MKSNATVWMMFVGAALLGTGSATSTARVAASRSEQVRTVYFSAQDSKGVPVTDLTTAELTVKEGGRDRVIASLQPATARMRVSVLVDDGGRGLFQGAVLQFLQATIARGEFSIRLLNPQPLKLVDYTNDVKSLTAALERLVQRGRIAVDGEQMIGAVIESAKELRLSKAARPVIVALSGSGETTMSDQADETLTALRNSGASLNVLYITGVETGRVLGDGPRQSGGMTQQAGSGPAIAPALAKIATHLMSQYVMTYTLPDDVKPNARLALATKRKGVTLIAPSQLPD